MISTRLTQRFGIRHPIVCAPMAYVTGGAAALSRAGGLGIVGGAYAGTVGEPDLETEIAQAKSGELGVGFITWALECAPKMLTKAVCGRDSRSRGRADLMPQQLWCRE